MQVVGSRGGPDAARACLIYDTSAGRRRTGRVCSGGGERRSAARAEIDERSRSRSPRRPSARPASRPPRRSRGCGSTSPCAATAKLRTVIERVNHDDQLKGWWHVANVNAVARIEINDHSWVHIQIVTNIALKLLRQLTKHGVEPAMVTDYGMARGGRRGRRRAGGADPLHRHVGAPPRPRGLQPLPRRAEAARAARRASTTSPTGRSIVSEVLQGIISHRADGEPLTLEAGILRVADALDMEQGRSRIPFERGHVGIHSLSAAAIEDVSIGDGEEKPIRIEITMNNSSGIYQVDGLLKAKLARLGPGAVRRGGRPHRHRGREAPRPPLPARDLTRAGAPALQFRALRDRLMVGRLTLDQVVEVRVLVPQPLRKPRSGGVFRLRPYDRGRLHGLPKEVSSCSYLTAGVCSRSPAARSCSPSRSARLRPRMPGRAAPRRLRSLAARPSPRASRSGTT